MNKKTQKEWDLFWLRLARQYATGSKDPSTQVGAIVVDSNNRLKSAGYNNFDRDSDDNPKEYQDRDRKLSKIKHAEVAALQDLTVKGITDCTIYIYPFMPCEKCASMIIQDWRIKRIVTTDYIPNKWRKSFGEAKKSIKSAKMDFEQIRITEI